MKVVWYLKIDYGVCFGYGGSFGSNGNCIGMCVLIGVL